MLVGVVAVWIAAGIRPLGDDEFGVVDGPLIPGEGLLIEGNVALAPPLLARLHRYPRAGVELPLPQAQEAQLRSADGSRYGLRGWATVRPRIDSWRRVHAAAGGAGLASWPSRA